jgi:hypothetical protein
VAIIAEFDNYVFASMKSESFKKVIEEEFSSQAFPIERTTSKKCRDHEKSEALDKNGEPLPLRITWESR